MKMKYKQEFDRMLGDWWKHSEYIKESLEFLENNNSDEVRRILATLMSINQKRIIREIGYNYMKGWVGFRNDFFQKEHPYKLKEECCSWMDHPASLYNKDKKNRILISEPYGISLESIRDLIRFCEDNNYNCKIGGVFFNSIHFPNNTIQIALTKNGRTKTT